MKISTRSRAVRALAAVSAALLACAELAACSHNLTSAESTAIAPTPVAVASPASVPQGRVPLGVADRPRLSGAELEQHAVVVDHHAAVGALPGPEHNALGLGEEGPRIAVAPVRLGGEEDIEIQVRPLVATLGTGPGRGAEEDQAGDPRVCGGRAHQ